MGVHPSDTPLEKTYKYYLSRYPKRMRLLDNCFPHGNFHWKSEIIYTTNLIENLNGKIRKYTKSKLSFPSDDAVKKTVYLSLMEIEKKWTQAIHNRGLIMNQFILIFENRIQK